jgi:hypothetical protein
MTPTHSTVTGVNQYTVREKSVTYMTYLPNQDTYRVVSEVIMVKVGDVVGFEFLDKITFTYSNKPSCLPGINTFR